MVIKTNMETIPGYRIVQLCGFVSGSTVRAKNCILDLGASMKNAIGGELKSYTDLLREAREEAISRMEKQAATLGANAIVNIRLATSSVASGASELFAYGTAVKAERIQ